MDTIQEEFEHLFLQWLVAARARPVDVARRDGALKLGAQLLASAGKKSHPWFETALLDKDRQFFANAVLFGRLPRSLLKSVARAAVRGPDASSNEAFVSCALKSYPRSVVEAALKRAILELVEPDQRQRLLAHSALYWLSTAYTFERERLASRASKLSAEERIKWFLSADDDTRIAIIYTLPWKDPGLPQHLIHLLNQARAIVAWEGSPFLRGQLNVASS